MRIPNVAEQPVRFAALRYAEAGFAVFPVDPATKRPLDPATGRALKWGKRATTDPVVIDRWFAGRDDLGIAIHLGKSGPHGLIVIDVDRPDDVPSEMWERFEGTAWQQTREDSPRRVHIVYEQRPGEHLGNSPGTFARFGDVRGDGGYVVVAPTRRATGAYHWLTHEIAVRPDWVSEACQSSAGSNPGTSKPLDWGEAAQWVREHSETDPGDLVGLEMVRDLARDAKRRVSAGESRHETYRDLLRRMVAEAEVGAYSATVALGVLRRLWLADMAEADEERQHGEFIRLLVGAIALQKQGKEKESPAGGSPNTESPADPVTRAIEKQAQAEFVRLVAVDRAKDQYAAFKLGETENVEFLDDDDFFGDEREEVEYLVDEVFPKGALLLVSAIGKGGKTQLRHNMTHALVYGGWFLGEFYTRRPTGTIALLDTEMSPEQIEVASRKIGLASPEARGKVKRAFYRGKARTLDFRDDKIRDKTAARLRDMGTSFIVLDPLGPVLRSLGIDENMATEVGPFIQAYRTMVIDAGVTDGAVIFHHSGHTNKGRPRGSSVFQDDPDVMWSLTANKHEETGAITDRKLHIQLGRDVEAQSLSLDNFDPLTGVITGERLTTEALRQAKMRTSEEIRERKIQQIIDYLDDKGAPNNCSRDVAKRRYGVVGGTTEIAEAVKRRRARGDERRTAA